MGSAVLPRIYQKLSVSTVPATILAQAMCETPAESPVGYVHADAVALPFPNASFDAVSCYGALYLMADPVGSLREMIRVQRPGGRIAVVTTCARGPSALRRAASRRSD
jgi:ubiquinone/menaquinone biosynthesis C-methylase UbiE